MIINATHSQATASLLQSASSRLQKSTARAGSEAAAAPTDSAADSAVIISQNMASTVSPLQDTAATRAALQAVRKQFMAQPQVAMLAQANQLPQNALRLLQ